MMNFGCCILCYAKLLKKGSLHPLHKPLHIDDSNALLPQAVLFILINKSGNELCNFFLLASGEA